MTHDTPTLGGLPITDWVGRTVKLSQKWKARRGSPNHYIKGKLLEVLNSGQIRIKPRGHFQEEIVDLDSLRACWVHNQDLKAKASALRNEALQQEFEEETEPTIETPDTMIAEIHTFELPTIEEFLEEIDNAPLPEGPRVSVANVTASQLKRVAELLETVPALEKEVGDYRELFDAAQEQLRSRRQELAELGVVFELEVATDLPLVGFGYDKGTPGGDHTVIALLTLNSAPKVGASLPNPSRLRKVKDFYDAAEPGKDYPLSEFKQQTGISYKVAAVILDAVREGLIPAGGLVLDTDMTVTPHAVTVRREEVAQ